jgi:hypothetical protein
MTIREFRLSPSSGSGGASASPANLYFAIRPSAPPHKFTRAGSDYNSMGILVMSAIYKDARLKLKRAKKHIADFTAAVNALEDACTATVEYHAQGGQSLKHEIPDADNALDDLSLIAGDAIHNLRSALDFAWYDTISRCLPDKLSDKTKFPVMKTRQDLEGTLHGIEVDTRCPRLFECMVTQIQPYKGGDNSIIWTLHDLDISDKHLLLLSLERC